MDQSLEMHPGATATRKMTARAKAVEPRPLGGPATWSKLHCRPRASGGVPCHGDRRTAVTSGPLQQGTDSGLMARRRASRAAGRARLAVRGPELTAVAMGC